jgi:hypothetical protein
MGPPSEDLRITTREIEVELNHVPRGRPMGRATYDAVGRHAAVRVVEHVTDGSSKWRHVL